MTCVDVAQTVEARIDEIRTQYRESPNLLFVLRTYMRIAVETYQSVCDLPERFDIMTATGDQLTLLGKRLGWPRCHCVCDTSPVFGFYCEDDINLRPVVGFECVGSVASAGWANCDSGLSTICLDNDEVYRTFLLVRRYQILKRYDLDSLETCLKLFFGPQALVLYGGQGRVVLAPGRDLSDSEISLLQLYSRVLPIPLGIVPKFHFDQVEVFGFGEGWGGFNEPNLAATLATAGYTRTGKVFGFCEDQGGFCEFWSDGLPLLKEDGQPLLDETGLTIYSDTITEDAGWTCVASAPWMCEIDVRTYTC